MAARFRELLEATGLSREAFVVEVGGAVTARSLFAVLSGQRKPSRALALLVERTWGFRARYLLEGEAPAWAKPERPRGAALTGGERELLAFYRSSPENARAVDHAVGMARLWSDVFGRTLAMLRELEACASPEDPDGAALYPLVARLAYDECQRAARKHARLGELAHLRRVHKLSDRFLARYVGELPRRLLSPREAAALEASLERVRARRAERLVALEASMDGLRATLVALCELGSPRPLLRARAATRGAKRRRDAEARLERVAASARLPEGARAEIAAALRDLRASAEEAAGVGEGLRRLLADILGELEAEANVAPAQTTEELLALRERAVE